MTLEAMNAKTPEMLADLSRLIRHNSVKGAAQPGMPFGEGPAAALKEALEIASGMGFKTVNLDNYCGYAEMGEGEDLIGIAAHLDVVPAGEGWDSDPFTMTEKDGYVFGRGVSDDKGAVIASLYAMAAVRESGMALNKRVRLIMGCDEESGSQCMEHYNEVEEPITLGFTPDGNFPGIHGEKGGAHLLALSKKTKILDMHGGFVVNAVCNHCYTTIWAEDVDEAALKAAFDATPLTSVEFSHETCPACGKEKLIIDAIGTAAHASTPLLGVNAADYTMKALAEAGFEDDFVSFYNSHLGTACDGSGVGLKIADNYGDLTFNTGVVKTTDGVISVTIDIRYPVTFTPAQIEALCKPYLETEQGRIEFQGAGEPLFYPLDSTLVSCLYDAYVKCTGDTALKPMVIGGGTYAKSLNNIIAFGCEFVGTDNRIHNANERLKITELPLQAYIYTQAIKNLLEA